MQAKLTCYMYYIQMKNEEENSAAIPLKFPWNLNLVDQRMHVFPQLLVATQDNLVKAQG